MFWADGAATSDQWIANGAETGGKGSPYDFAVLHVAPDKASGTKSLEEKVGSALPVWFDAPSVTKMGNIGAWGYPAAPPFDGETLQSCAGTAFDDTFGGTQSQGVPCNMTGGSSGGPWFTGGLQNSINSFGYDGVPNTMFGPYWGTVIQGAYNTASAS